MSHMVDQETLTIIYPDWPAPERVRAALTTRSGGASLPPYDSLNLGDHVGDDAERVAHNRRRLRDALALPEEPRWLEQVHGCDVIPCNARDRRGDAVIADRPGQVCAVLTADCLPILLCDRAGSRVAAVHAGWRGLAAGVIENTLQHLALPGESLLAWLGPAIGPQQFEVGDDVRACFVGQDEAVVPFFIASRPGHWLADIYALARRRLQLHNLGYVGGGEYCTVSQPERFFSYRRDGVTGRMASLIWLDPASGERTI